MVSPRFSPLFRQVVSAVVAAIALLSPRQQSVAFAFAPALPKSSPLSHHRQELPRPHNVPTILARPPPSGGLLTLQSAAGPPPDLSSISAYVDSIAAFEGYDKWAWFIGFILSLYLLWDIYTGNGDCKCETNVNGGFCVTGFDCNGSWVEGTNQKFLRDSHTLAGYADIVLLVVAIGIPLLDRNGVPIPAIGDFEYDISLPVVLVAISLIVVHGYLHLFNLADFYKTPFEEGRASKGIINQGEDEDDGAALFSLLSYIISYACISDYSAVPQFFEKLFGEGNVASAATLAVSVAVGWVIVQVTEGAVKKGSDPISVFFLMTQLLVTGVAFAIPNEVKADYLMGWTFAATCGVALLERLKCRNFLRGIGGHVYYDLFLHISVLTSYWVHPTEGPIAKFFFGV